VCIALYDLGEFSRFYPNGRIVVSTLGGKDVAMKLISDKNPEIQRTALQAVSKIMVQSWEFMR
jgi:V-type H+-transporting ATPase subunit H